MAQAGRSRPGVVTLLAVLNILGGGVVCLLAVAMFFLPTASASTTGHDDVPMLFAVIAVVGLVFGMICLACGFGLWTMKSYGRTLQLILACIGLLRFPGVTVISGLIIWYLSKRDVKVRFA
jgi:hypothetical protein